MTRYAHKPCKQCGQDLTLRNFYAHPHFRDGRMNVCKACHIANVTENRELKAGHYVEWKRQWAARPENVEKRKAYTATERGREVHRAACRRYYRFKKLEARA